MLSEFLLVLPQIASRPVVNAGSGSIKPSADAGVLAAGRVCKPPADAGVLAAGRAPIASADAGVVATGRVFSAPR